MATLIREVILMAAYILNWLLRSSLLSGVIQIIWIQKGVMLSILFLGLVLQSLFDIIDCNLPQVEYIDDGHIGTLITWQSQSHSGLLLLIEANRRNAIEDMQHQIVQIDLLLILEIDNRNQVLPGYILQKRHHLQKVVIYHAYVVLEK